MTVDLVISLWPQLESTGLRLGGPAPAKINGDWMVEFMKKVELNKLRIDFVTMHWYAPPNAKSFINKVNEIYKTYNRPIWITEFAVADWSATDENPSKYTEQQVLDFMNVVIPQLESLTFVERYSWKNEILNKDITN